MSTSFRDSPGAGSLTGHLAADGVLDEVVASTTSNYVLVRNDATTAAITTTDFTAVGPGAAMALNSTTVGKKATAVASGVAVGEATNAAAVGAVAIGNNAVARLSGTSVGYNAIAGSGATSTVMLGTATVSGASATKAIAIGNTANVGGTEGVAIGYGANTAAFTGQMAVGYGASTGGSGTYSMAIGHSATANAGNAIAVGHSTLANAPYAVAVGDTATCGATSGVSIGQNSSLSAAASDSVAIGNGATGTKLRSIALGNGAATTAADDSIAIFGSYLKGSNVTAAKHLSPTVDHTDANDFVDLGTSALRYKNGYFGYLYPARFMRAPYVQFQVSNLVNYTGTGNSPLTNNAAITYSSSAAELGITVSTAPWTITDTSNVNRRFLVVANFNYACSAVGVRLGLFVNNARFTGSSETIIADQTGAPMQLTWQGGLNALGTLTFGITMAAATSCDIRIHVNNGPSQLVVYFL